MSGAGISIVNYIYCFFTFLYLLAILLVCILSVVEAIVYRMTIHCHNVWIYSCLTWPSTRRSSHPFSFLGFILDVSVSAQNKAYI